MATPARPPLLWRQFPAIRQDVSDAEQQLTDGSLLSARLWAALLWSWTDVPTVPVCWSNFYHCWCYASTLTDPTRHDTAPNYYPIDRLADRRHAWYEKAAGDILDWIALLSDERNQQIAWNAAHGVYDADVPGLPTARGTMHASIAEARRSVARRSEAAGMSRDWQPVESDARAARQEVEAMRARRLAQEGEAVGRE